MTKQELEKAIENGESVWFADNCNEKVWEIDLNEKYKPEIYLDQILYVYQNINDRFKQELFIENIYKTKAEAEHYLHHADITRTEQLPFLTWEEFKNGKELFFTNASGYPMCLMIVDTKLGKKIGLGGANGYFDLQKTWNLTEENFYKAYDECVRLFRGEV